MRILAALVSVFAICVSVAVVADGNHGYIGDEIENVPLFDAHMHYKKPAWSAYPPDAVLRLMDETGVATALVS